MIASMMSALIVKSTFLFQTKYYILHCIKISFVGKSALLPVVLHEMLRRHLKGLLHALADRDARHHHDELAPTIAAIQLKHVLI